MRRQLSPLGLERTIVELATAQYGVVSHQQLHDLGVGDSGIDHRVARGELHPMHRSAYVVGHRALRTEGRYMAAVLACGPRAVLSHRSAADLLGMRPAASGAVDVSVPDRSARRHEGIAIHRPRTLGADEVTVSRGSR